MKNEAIAAHLSAIRLSVIGGFTNLVPVEQRDEILKESRIFGFGE